MRCGVTPDERKQLSRMLFDLVPTDGTSIGNGSLRDKLKEPAKKTLTLDLTDEAYWELRNELIAQGLIEKGRGYGGSVYRVKNVEAKQVKAARTKSREAELYPMVGEYIERTWVKDNGITQFVLERTALQGKKKTGGKWTRPENPGKSL
jgi:hypothetical protein